MARFDWIFARWQWWRRWRGGHWERWYFDHPGCCELWLPNPHGVRPGLGRGTPECEQW